MDDMDDHFRIRSGTSLVNLLQRKGYLDHQCIHDQMTTESSNATEIPEALCLGFKLASAVARSQVRNGDPDEVFTAAITHDIGNFALEELAADQFPVVYSKNSVDSAVSRPRNLDNLIHPNIVLTMREIGWIGSSPNLIHPAMVELVPRPMISRPIPDVPGITYTKVSERSRPPIKGIEAQKPSESILKWATTSPKWHISHYLYYLNDITNSPESAQKAQATTSLKRYHLLSSYAVLRTRFESAPDCLRVMLLMQSKAMDVCFQFQNVVYHLPPRTRRADKPFIALLNVFLAYGHGSYWVQKWGDTMHHMQHDGDPRLVAFWNQQYTYWDSESALPTRYADNEYMAFPSAFALLILQATDKPTTLFRDTPEVAACFDWLVVWLFRTYLTGVALTPILMAFYRSGAEGQTAEQNEYLKANLNVTLQAASLLGAFRRTSFATDWLTRWASYFDDQLDVERLRIKHQRAETEETRSETEELEIQSVNDRELLALEDAEILPSEQKYQTAMNTIRGYLRSIDGFADFELIIRRLSERKKELPVGFNTLKLVGYLVDTELNQQYSTDAYLRSLLSKEEQIKYAPLISKLLSHPFAPGPQQTASMDKDLVSSDNSVHAEWLLCDDKDSENKRIFKVLDEVSVGASLLCCPTCGLPLVNHRTQEVQSSLQIKECGATLERLVRYAVEQASQGS
ncbi:hypothetical protein C8J56DRAFT_1164616 [Mycena floridula]|nr:hypothetical protein C8J56DRAFT_1164616 [Mycena floridula]